MHHGGAGLGRLTQEEGSSFGLTERDVSLMDNIRRLQSDFELEEESEDENETSCFRTQLGRVNVPESQEGGGSIFETLSEDPTGTASVEIDVAGAEVIKTGEQLCEEVSCSQDLPAREGGQATWSVENMRPEHNARDSIFPSHGTGDFQLRGLEASIDAPEVGETLQQEQGPGDQDGDSDSERYDSLYQEHVRRQRDAAPESRVMEEDLEEDDRFEISQPESDSQQQPLMTNLSQRDQQFLASIRQLDQVELEEEEMSDASETDSDEERPETPRLAANRREDITFDTTLPAMHTYLGEFDDVAGGRAFEEGGSLVTLPLFYLDGVVLFPGDSLPLRVIQPRFQSAVRRAMRQTAHACTIAVVLCRGYLHPEGPGVATVGTTAEIRQVKEQDDGTFNIVAKGRQRFYVRRISFEGDDSASAHVQIIPEERPLRMPRAAFGQLAAWPSPQSGRVPSALESRESAGSPTNLSPTTYTRTPRRASTGGIPTSSISRRGRHPPDVSPSSGPRRSRRRVSFDGGAVGGVLGRLRERPGLAVFDFPIEEERETQGATRKADEPAERPPGISGIGAGATPPAGRQGARHVATPRSALFLPAYKRRKQRRLGKDWEVAASAERAPEEEKQGGGREASHGPEIVWPELCPVRHDLVRGITQEEEAGSQAAGDLAETSIGAETVRGVRVGGEATPQNVDIQRLLESRWAGTNCRWGGFQGERHGSRHDQTPPKASPRQSGDTGDGDESTEKWQGVSKAWAADDATWRIRAPLSAWPYWVYRMHDAYVLARRVADLMRQVVPARKVDDLLNEPEALSYYVASNLPLQDATRQELLETVGTVYRLRKETKILETLDKLRCKACEVVIASKSDLMVMSADGPIGAYVNPHGHIHETLTLRRVQGLALDGFQETENSWFPGYAWTIAHCQNCGYHMGWKFTAVRPGMTPDCFWGVTRAHLAESTASEHQSDPIQMFTW
ncbi:Putative ATP-dependent protease PIL [Klebsormidium nitens]|uniref:Protein cereblon n=1 Tax=Klebsormidium nitens TaxID=105231 RepID=A0A1Y1IBP3_KLENI|nr:Putative ATP-dependent protease PIL [Klebsormidium nitens]|eukprot:GAQ86521.1 Putative ATP-dependent protease PIL [Klebsormidium nitens]